MNKHPKQLELEALRDYIIHLYEEDEAAAGWLSEAARANDYPHFLQTGFDDEIVDLLPEQDSRNARLLDNAMYLAWYYVHNGEHAPEPEFVKSLAAQVEPGWVVRFKREVRPVHVMKVGPYLSSDGILAVQVKRLKPASHEIWMTHWMRFETFVERFDGFTEEAGDA